MTFHRCLAALAIAIAGLVFAAAPSLAAPLGVVGVSGATGTGDGQFQSTGGLAVNESTGIVYVIDTGGERVERFDAAGQYLDSFGGPGSGNGQLSFDGGRSDNPTPQLAIDQVDGAVYVADTGNDRVQKFTAAGAYVSQIGTAGTGNGQLTKPQGVAVDPTDRSVYVADTGNFRVQKFTGAGAYAAQFGSMGDGDGQFGEFGGPIRVGVDAAGLVYVLDSNVRVERFSATGTFDPTFAPVDAPFPSDLAVDASGDHVFIGAFAPDYSENVIVEVGPDGLLIDRHAVGAKIVPRTITGIGVKAGAAAYVVGGDGYDGSLNARLYRLGAVTPQTASTSPATDIAGRSAALHAIVNPSGAPAVSYRFEVSDDFCVTFSRQPASNVDAGAGTSDVAVDYTVTGLKPNLFYCYQLVVDKPYNPSVITPLDFFQTLTVAPTIANSSATPQERGAELRAEITPESIETTYTFEYGLTDTYGKQLPATSASIGDGRDPVAVAKTIGGLEPGTTYHYRVVATNAAGTANGPDGTFTTKVPALPGAVDTHDGRAYEQVSPVEKNGNYISEVTVVQSAPSGDTVAYGSGGSFAGALASTQGGYYRSRRTADGWVADSLAPPQLNKALDVVSTPTIGLSTDLSSAISFSTRGLAPGGVDGNGNLYRHTSAKDGYQLLATTPTPYLVNAYANPVNPQGSAYSDNLNHFLFETKAQLLPDAAPGGTNVYESDEGELRLVNVMPDGTPAPGGGALTLGLRKLPFGARYASADGRVAGFLSPDPNTAALTALYARIDGTTTRLVSRSHRPGDDPTVPRAAVFLGMSADGSAMFFSSADQLTTDAPPTNGRPSLYRYDVDSDALVDLTPDSRADVRNLLGVSDDGETAYFGSTTALAPGAVDGDRNLFVVRGTTVRFIAKLDQGETLEPFGGMSMSASGRYFAFGTFGRPTGAPNANAACQYSDISDQGNFFTVLAGPPNTCANVFVYDADAGQLRCATCGESAAADRQSVIFAGGRPITARFGRSVLEDGTVFLTSAEALVPQDVNGVEDVYRWHAGETTLISTGKSSAPSIFMDASPDGRDVFLLTSERLVTQDTDDLQDLYDARVGGGIASQNPVRPEPAPPCSEDACQGPLTKGAVAAVAATIAFAGDNAAGPVRPGTAGVIAKVTGGRSTIGTTARLRISVPGKGRLTISGSGLRKATMSVRKAGSSVATVRLSARSVRLLTKRARLSLTARVAFTSEGARTTVARVGLTFRRPRGGASRTLVRPAAISSNDPRKRR